MYSPELAATRAPAPRQTGAAAPQLPSIGPTDYGSGFCGGLFVGA